MDELNGLFILALVLLLLLLLLQVRLRVLAEFGDQGPLVRIGFGPIRLTVYPLPEKRSNTQKKRKERKKALSTDPKKEKKPEGMTLDRFREWLDLAMDSLREVSNRLRIDLIYLRLDWGLEDPADAAISYGYANAVLSGLLTLLEVNFRVIKRDAEIRLDYTLEQPRVYAKCSCSLRVRQLLSLGLGVGMRAYRTYRRQRNQSKRAEQHVMIKK